MTKNWNKQQALAQQNSRHTEQAAPAFPATGPRQTTSGGNLADDSCGCQPTVRENPESRTGRTEANMTILVADDNEDDTFFLARAFKKAGASATIRIVQDGEQAIHYLQGHGLYGNRAQFPFPNLFVMDSKLPGSSGLELLDWLRGQQFCQPPVVGVLSGVECKPEIEKALALGANFYFTKPNDFEDLVVIARQLAEKCVAGPTPLERTPKAPCQDSAATDSCDLSVR
jgi:CheY-like chemotaxis protein